MTTRFRLDAVTLDTTDGQVCYAFPSDLTVLAGRTGVGKTTLLEMIKYGFGCNGVLAPVALQYVNDVTLDVTIDQSRLRISRSIDSRKGRFVRVTDLVTHERLPDHHVDSTQPSLSTLLLAALGLPGDVRAAARTGTSSNVGARITFGDVLPFLYVAQYDMNRDIANSQETYREPKRKAVFELLFGLTNARILAMRSDVNRLNGELAAAEKEHETVLTFLRDSTTTSRIEAERAISDAISVQQAAQAEQAALRDAIEPVTDRETQVLHDLLTEAKRALADARATVTSLIREQAEYRSERRRVQTDVGRLHRMRDAGERLASIEFTVCPRCMQSLTDRNPPEGSCRVCLQPDPVTAPDNTDQYEASQLADQLAEMDGQLDTITRHLTVTAQAVTDREELVASLIAKLDARTAERITPRLQVLNDVANHLAYARAQQQRFELVLRQWDRADDLGAAAGRLRTDRERIQADMARSQVDLDTRRREILDSLSEEFLHAVTTLGIPGIETASIHPTSYLPLLNGKQFSAVSRGGGIITATQIAYWTSLLTVALRRGDTFYPAFLLIDSPRLALNTAEELSAALYRRMVTQADVSRGQLQLIIADNEVPAEYRRDYDEIDFTYERPTVWTVRHPGPAAVELIGKPTDDET